MAGPIGGAASERLPILGLWLLAPPWAASGRLDDVHATTLIAWTWRLLKGRMRPEHGSTAQCPLARAMILGVRGDGPAMLP